MKIKPSEIKIKERIRKDNGDIEALCDSLGEDLQGAPITITKDKVLIDGYRRLKAWQMQYKNEPIECYIYEGETDYKEMEAKMLLLLKEPSIDEVNKARELAETIIRADLPEINSHKLDKTVGKKIGKSERYVRQIKRVMNKNLDNEIGKKEAEEIRNIGRNQSIDAADRKIKEIRDEKLNKEIRDQFPKNKQKPDINKFLQDCIDRQAMTNSVLKEVGENKKYCQQKKVEEFIGLVKRTLMILTKNFKEGEICKPKQLK